MSKYAVATLVMMGKYWRTTIIEAHWPTHKPDCHPFNEETSLKLKPFYPSISDVVSTSSILRSGMGYPDLSKGKTFSSGRKAASKHEYPKHAVIKVQLPAFTVQGQTGDCFAYTKNRDFVCKFRQNENPNAWESLIYVIKNKGVGGLKAYFAADMRSKDEILLKISEVLAEQPFWHLAAAPETYFRYLKGITYYKIFV